MGIFSFRKNWQARRDAEEQISKLASGGDSVEAKGRRKKINRAIGEQREISRRAFIQILGGGAVSAVASAGVIAGLMKFTGEPEYDDNRKPSVHVTPIVPLISTTQEDINKKIELQEYWKKISLEALESFRDADPRVEKLINFMKENAWYSIPMGPVVTQMVMRGNPEKLMAIQNSPHAFEVVYMPEEYANKMPAPILTETDGTMRIAANFRVREWLGIMLAHELSHEYDIKVNGENTHNKNEYLAGEVRAHLFEMNLLRSWNPESYRELIKRGIPLLEGVRKGAEIKKLIKLIQSLYPTTPEYASEHESSLGAASCLMAIAFEDARVKGKTDKELELVYQEILRNFGGGK